MKKYFSCILLVLSLLVTAGCGNKSSDPDNISSVFDGVVNVKIGDKEYECELRHTPEQVNRLEITSPPELNGLTFLWEGEKYQVLWKDLACELNKEFLPQGAFAEILIKILNSLTDRENINFENQDNEGSVFSGKIGEVDFNLTTSKNGIVRHISVPSKCLEAEFVTNE